ncbi:MAG: FHA domain-containing protein [ANME-2 cluster archaeon]|nr:FHA domain-containing protein [ANME-2 cluster archaeon]MBC2747902.1 FHA domain-containing protein [ANME-2 cluster archaeon]
MDGEAPVLVGQTGKLNGVRWLLDSESVLFGRSPDCKYVIPDRQVSRHHAVIKKTVLGYTIEDLGSKNGTFLNGKPIQEVTLLQDGDVIQMAFAQQLMFVGTEATVPLSGADVIEMGLAKLRIDKQAKRIWVGKQELSPPLSPPQFRFLELLFENHNRIVSRDEIVEYVWPDSEGIGVSEQAIDALVRRLRERLGELDPETKYVKTVRGYGFRLRNPL